MHAQSNFKVKSLHYQNKFSKIGEFLFAMRLQFFGCKGLEIAQALEGAMQLGL
jgi:hypothetical protein